MLLSEKTVEFTLSLQNSLNDHTFVKLSLGNYKGKEENLKNILNQLKIIQRLKMKFQELSKRLTMMKR